MSTTLREAMANAGIELTEAEQKQIAEERARKHRVKTVIERPDKEFKLSAITDEDFEKKKYQKDPTDDITEISKRGLDSERFSEEYSGLTPGYAVWCKDTLQLWHVPSELSLNQNFIYRGDLEIYKFEKLDELWALYCKTVRHVNPGVITRKSCYILDNPAGETYEVYYDSAYPSLKYGKATPNGMFIHSYDNRFHRDMAIMELDKTYVEASKKMASDMIAKEMGPMDAIIVSDGGWMKNTCSSAFYYIDADGIAKMSKAKLPSEPEQAVLIAEINGAYAALDFCMRMGKKNIKYYYDNTSIINVFRNRKTEYIQEIKDYKELLERMDREGYNVQFIELHPKTGDNRDMNNAALMFFHNYCDKECRELADIFKKNYRFIANDGDQSGTSYKQVKDQFKKNSQPGKSSGKTRPTNNQHNGNNRYGKTF